MAYYNAWNSHWWKWLWYSGKSLIIATKNALKIIIHYITSAYGEKKCILWINLINKEMWWSDMTCHAERRSIHFDLLLQHHISNLMKRVCMYLFIFCFALNMWEREGEIIDDRKCYKKYFINTTNDDGDARWGRCCLIHVQNPTYCI